MNPYLEKFVARIKCKNDNSTGFMISDRHLLTAWHSIEDVEEGCPIEVELDSLLSESATAVLKDYDEALDVAIIELVTPLGISNYFTFCMQPIRENSQWSTLGFPAGKMAAGAKLSGTVTRANVKNTDYDLDLEYTQKIVSIVGLSGSPLCINDIVVGVITKELDNSLGAISTNKLTDFLEKNSILNEVDVQDLSVEINRNTPVVENLFKKIFELESGYIFLKGSPGSGKTTVVESLSSEDKDIVILDKYIIREEDKENLIAVRVNHENILKWLEDIIYADLFNEIPPQSEKNSIQWIENIIQLFQQLSEKYIKLNRKCVIFIDGIEELVRTNNIEKFFQVLPIKLPNNIIVVISGQNEERLPIGHKAQVLNSIITVTPLPLIECQEAVERELPSLSSSLKRIVISKSESHPLYLRYLVEYVKNNFGDSDDVEVIQWLDTLPIVGGEIRVYYEAMWQGIKHETDQLYLLSLIARLRERVCVEDIIEMVTSSERIGFESTLAKVNHFLVSNSKIFIFHTSLIEFILENTKINNENIHSHISTYCTTHKVKEYSQRNILFHLLSSPQEIKVNTINYCHQEWADNCTKQLVEPDLILSDLKETLTYYLSEGCCESVVKILLLSQRIKFRYNNIFALYAHEMAEYLIAINKPEKAVSHLFRKSIPLVGLEEAVDFQYLLIAGNSSKEADIIYESVRNHFMSEYEAGSIAYLDLIHFFKATSLNNCLLSQTPNKDSAKVIQLLYKFLNKSSGQKQRQEINQEILCHILGHNLALLLLHRNNYFSVKDIEEQGVPLDSSISKVLLQAFDYVNYYSDFSGEECNVECLSEDIEYSLVKYGTPVENFNPIINIPPGILINYDVLKTLMDKHSFDEMPELREENGVDLNYGWHDYIFTKSMYKGFLNNNVNLPKIAPFSSKAWETSLEDIVNFIGLVSGKAWRSKINNLSVDDLSNSIIEVVLPALEFDLSAKVSFERAYMLLEDLMPNIYGAILDYFLKYSATYVTKFLDFVLQHSGKQLGLYTEGYREVVFTIIQKLHHKKEYKVLSFKLLKKLEEHIFVGVKNRWDRCPELIKLATEYAKLGSAARSDYCFQELLNSSMGPSWYKEDQLSLISTSLTMLEHHQIDWPAKELSAVLSFASGEMTFQRYVRMEKEALIASLCATGKVDKAIQYFQYETIPHNLITIIKRAEAIQIDSIEDGGGYDLGANYIDAQSAILNIIENTDNVRASIQWALCELFVIGDDRYLGQFAAIFSRIINDEERGTSANLKYYRNRLIKILLSDMDVDIRNRFIIELQAFLTASNYHELLALISKNKILVDLPPTKENIPEVQTEAVVSGDQEDSEKSIYLPGVFGKNSGIKAFDSHYLNAKDALEIENNEDAKEYLILSLKALQDAGWDIWSSNLGHSDDAFNDLLKVCNAEELLILLKPLILGELHSQDWFIANKILLKLNKLLSPESIGKLYGLVTKHIKLMVNPPKDTFNDYSWIDLANTENLSHNRLLCDLLISFFDYPTPVIYSRVSDLIKSIARLEAQFYIPILSQYSVSNKQSIAPEICAGIIYSLVIENKDIVSENLQINSFVNEILTCKHLVIKHTWLEIIKLTNKKNNALYKQEEKDLEQDLFQPSVPSTVKPKNLMSSEEVKAAIGKEANDILYALNQIGEWKEVDYLLLEQTLINHNTGKDLNSLVKIDKYISRAYQINAKSKILKEQVITGVNKVLLGRVTKDNITKIVSILRSYNPFFSSEKNRIFSLESLKIPLRLFLSGEETNPNSFLKKGNFEYLHYIESVYSEENNRNELIEISAILSRPGLLIEPETFQSNEVPILEQVTPTHNFKSFLYNNLIGDNYYGGRMVPAFINPHFAALPDTFGAGNEYGDCWVEERRWDSEQLGMPIREGTRLLVSSTVIDQLMRGGWDLIWRVNYNWTHQIIINRTTKEIYISEKS